MYLICNVILVSGAQHCEIYIFIFIYIKVLSNSLSDDAVLNIMSYYMYSNSYNVSYSLRKVMTNLQHIKKQRHYFVNKGLCSQGYGFSSIHVWMWSWTIKKAERWRTDVFELWCWRRHLRVPWTARRSNQSILKDISPGCSLEGMEYYLALKKDKILQYARMWTSW